MKLFQPRPHVEGFAAKNGVDSPERREEWLRRTKIARQRRKRQDRASGKPANSK